MTGQADPLKEDLCELLEFATCVRCRHRGLGNICALDGQWTSDEATCSCFEWMRMYARLAKKERYLEEQLFQGLNDR